MRFENKSFNERLDMCNRIEEGTEWEDIVSGLTNTARMFHAFEDFKCQILLVMAEEMCYEFCKMLQNREVDWEEYDAFPADIYSYFLGGARKLTKEEYELRSR